MPTPLPTAIRNQIISMINGIDGTGDYYFDWAGVSPSMFDLNKITAYPTATVETGNENNLDDFNTMNGGLYWNEIDVRIHAFVQVDESALAITENPIDHIDNEIDKAVEDLKRVFGNSQNLGGTCQNSMYNGYEKYYTEDFNRPAYFIFKLKVQYRQIRTNPEDLR